MNEELIRRIDDILFDRGYKSRETPVSTDELVAIRAALSLKYVPMTDAEWEKLYAEYEAICFDKSPSPRYIEAAVIRRAGLEVANG